MTDPPEGVATISSSARTWRPQHAEPAPNRSFSPLAMSCVSRNAVSTRTPPPCTNWAKTFAEFAASGKLSLAPPPKDFAGLSPRQDRYDLRRGFIFLELRQVPTAQCPAPSTATTLFA